GAIVAVRFGVNVWLQGVASPAWETLTNVVPEGRRDQTRAFLNGGPTQVGTAIAGVVQLVGQQVLSGTQLTLVGLAAAVVTLLVAWKIRRSYTSALVDALSAGRPTVFGDVPVGAPIVLQQDAQARALAIAALRDPDARMRRVAVAMLDPEGDERAAGALIRALEDEDALVRSNALRAIARAGAPASLFEPAMRDPDPNVRVAAVLGLRANGASSATPTDLLDDPDPSVAAAAAVNLLGGPRRHDAAGALSRLLGAEEPSLRVEALRQVRSAAPEDAEELASSLAAEAPGVVRAAALETLASSGAKTVITAALDALDSDDHAVRRAALDALHHVDVRGSEDAIRGYARSRGAWAEADRARAASVPIAPGGGLARESSELLRDALRSRGRSHAVAALSALAVLSDDREAMRTALESLGTSDPGQLANALETLEVAGGAARVRPLLILWEAPQQPRPPDGDAEGLEPLLHDDDPLIRACAELVRAAGDGGDQMTRSRTSMSTVERILILRRIPLFAELSPAELERVAAIAEEHAYADGEVIAAEGELGEELHIVVEGTVRVVRGEGNRTIARRGSGDVVGEMSIITRAPRVATLIAEGDVRTVRIGSREFEGMIRERPEVALAVMRVLAGRITTEAAQ
ncbi:MAG TPA: HEAT repeat domain-containing protein, partial [Actinomycetota bacterium]|nr:HEAT repeat domain-containing protein [Actinomycetota bacterium]